MDLQDVDTFYNDTSATDGDLQRSTRGVDVDGRDPLRLVDTHSYILVQTGGRAQGSCVGWQLRAAVGIHIAFRTHTFGNSALADVTVVFSGRARPVGKLQMGAYTRGHKGLVPVVQR